MACHASANLPAAIPNWVEPERVVGGMAEAGTNVHVIFEEIWKMTPSERGFVLEIIEYVDALMRTRRFKKLIEHSMTATWLSVDPVTGEHPQTTADLVLYTADEMHVIDTKWGRIPVEVSGNKQLLYYDVTYGALAPKATGVTNHILQPRAKNMSSEFVSATEIKAFMDEAIIADQAIHAGDLTFGPTDHGCMFCPANPHGRGAKGKPFCPAMLQMLYPTIVDEDELLADL